MGRATKVARGEPPGSSQVTDAEGTPEGHNHDSEVMNEYFRRRSEPPPGVVDRKELDPIDSALVAGVRINKPKGKGKPLLAKAMQTVPWLQTPLEILAGTQSPQPVDEPRSEIDLPRSRNNSALMDRWIPDLVTKGLLVKRERNQQKQNVRATCALFSVLKRNGCHRIVYNGQQGNALLQRPPGLRIFLLEHLHEAIRRWGPRWTVSLDYRHHFYQIPMPQDASFYFAVQANHPPRDQYFPRAIPMGWHTAPLLGQAVTWAIALYRSLDDPPLGVRSEILDRKEMPEFVSLWTEDREVGRIFVLLDGVAILTEDAGLADQWRIRLDRNSDTFKCVIKNESEDKAAKGRTQVLSGLREGGVTFAGINWQGSRARADRALGSFPSVNVLRDASALVGSLMWDIRARGESLVDHEHLIEEASAIGSASQRQEYNHPYRMDPERKIALQKVWSRLQKNDYRELAQPEFYPKALVRAVTDALLTARAFIIFGTPEDPWDVKQQSCQLDLPPQEQGDQEFQAIVDLAEHVTAEHGSPCLIYLATDAEAVRKAISRGYSPSLSFRRKILRLNELGHKMLLCRVPGPENLADCPTRRADLCPVRKAQTIERLQLLMDTEGVEDRKIFRTIYPFS
jgi:hypothetical protein